MSLADLESMADFPNTSLTQINLTNIAIVVRVVDEFTAPLRAASEGLHNLDTAVKTSSIAQRLQSIGQSAAQTASTIGTAANAMQSALSGLVKPSQDFEKAMSNLSAIAGADQAGLNALRAKALEVGQTGWASAPQAVAAMSELSGYGFKPDQIIAAMAPVVNLSRAAGMTAAEAAALTGAALRQFSLDPGETNRITDMLSAASKNSSMSVPAIGSALTVAAPAATDAGLSPAQTITMVTFLANSGIAASETGNVLAGMIARLATLPAPAAEAMEKLGVSTRDANGNLLPLPTTLAAIDKAMADNNYGSAQRLEAMGKIFGPQPGTPGQQSIPGSNRLIQGMATGGFADLHGSIANSAGQTAQMAATKDDNLDGRFQQWNNALQNLEITLGTALLPLLTDAIQSLTRLANTLSRFAEANPELTRIGVTLAAVAAAAVAVMMVFGALASGAGVVMAALGGLSGPVLVTAGAMAAAAVLIYRHWDNIAAFFQGLWSEIAAGAAPLQPVFDRLVTAIQPFLAAGSWLGGVMESLLSPVQGVSGAVQELGESWGRVAAPWLVSYLTMLMDRFTGLVNVITGILTLDFDTFSEGLRLSFSNIPKFFNAMIDQLTGINIWSLLTVGSSEGLENVKAVIDRVILTMLQELQGGLASGVGFVETAINDLCSLIIDTFKRQFGINSPSTVFAEFGGWLMEGLAAGLLMQAQTVLDTLASVGDSILNKAKSLLGFETAPATPALQATGALAGAVNDNSIAGRTGQTAQMTARAAVVTPFVPPPAPAMAKLARGPGTAGGGMGPGGSGGGPVTVNLSVNITGATNEDIVRKLENWVRHDGGRLIADAVNRETQRRERTQFMSGGR